MTNGFFIALAALGCLCMASAIPVVSVNNGTTSGASLFEAEFLKFKTDFDKVYPSAEHEAERFVHFVNNLHFIRNFKSDHVHLAVNQFADLSTAEFKELYLGFSDDSRSNAADGALADVAGGNETLPATVDWVTKGAVTAVKNQKHCGSCWAFSATGAIEGAIFVKYGTLTPLSEQALVSCDSVDHGCHGGKMDNGFKYAEQNGLPSETDYPYTASVGTCDSSESAVAHSKVVSFTDVPKQNELELKKAVAQQPVSVAIEADQKVFHFYKSGVIKASDGCGSRLDHGVLVVGYGTADDGTMFWKIKNSWGPAWGEAGYVRVERTDSKSSAGTCGLATNPSYPTA